MNPADSDPLSFDVAGKHVLVSGGRGDIGAAFAAGFADRGARVIVCDIKPSENVTSCQEMQHEHLDVCDEEAVNALAASIPRLDVLIHCAGVLAPFKEHRPAVFQKIVDVHLFGNMRLATAFRPHLRQHRGCIINVGSVYSFFGHARLPAYAAAKAAMLSLTKSLAIAYAEDGIRVNGIAPGYVDTEMTKSGRQDAEINASLMARCPMKRWAKPIELVGPALFLASAASSFINGVMIPVDGGYSAS